MRQLRIYFTINEPKSIKKDESINRHDGLCENNEIENMEYEKELAKQNKKETENHFWMK